MDDYLGCADSVKEAVQIINDVIDVHNKGGFKICNWVSNSKDVLHQINNPDVAIDAKEIDDGLTCERILGLWWNHQTDEFSFQLKFHKLKNPKILDMTERPTKREVLVVLMSIFDPLGFLANILIGGKILLQSIWHSAIGWDEKLLDEQFILWQDWCKKLQNISTIKIPRLLTSFSLTDSSIQLHVFCDASKLAYASCAYLRFQCNDQIECRLLTSKSRVAPLKPTSIPRLELQAALQGAKMYNYLKNALEIKFEKVVLWSDSEVVLCWIRSSSKRFKVFVAQRLGEIHELTEPTDWRHVPSKSNIADDATKVKPIDYSANNDWINGPKFLYEDENNWPKLSPFDKNILDSEDCTVEYVHVITEPEVDILTPNLEKFSKWTKFLRSMAWLLRFVNIIKNKRQPVTDTELVSNEISNAEHLIYRKIQMDSYSDEISCIKKGKMLPTSSKIRTLPMVMFDDKLLRLTGRLDNVNESELSYNSKNPILLDGKHPMTTLIIEHYHRHNSHIGHDTVISNLRQTFWITGCRNALKKVIQNCQFCKNKRAKPQIPKMAQLPVCRINPTVRPFIKTGVDYFGPFEVVVHRSREKRYGVIFTCMVTRAVHLEIAQDLSSNAFLHVFRQFGCRRGFPEEMYSDNGTNFRKAEKEIRQALDSWPADDNTVKFMTMKKIKWYFNPPTAPHMGGAWERLIQSVKNHLSYLLHEKYPKEFVLKTLFCETENMLNSRPLTDVPLNYEDSTPLTPNDFLIGPSSLSLQFCRTTHKDVHLLNMWRASQHLTDELWKEWKKIYRQHILIDRKWSKDCSNLIEGDVVLLIDEETPRNVWPKGKVIKVFPSRDGRTRIVDVKTVTGIYRRPVSKLIRLDVSKDESIPSV